MIMKPREAASTTGRWPQLGGGLNREVGGGLNREVGGGLNNREAASTTGRRPQQQGGGLNNREVASITILNLTYSMDGIPTPIFLNFSLSSLAISSGCKDSKPKVPPPSLKS